MSRSNDADEAVQDIILGETKRRMSYRSIQRRVKVVLHQVSAAIRRRINRTGSESMTIKEWLQRGIEIEEEIADLQAVNPVVFLDEINVAVYEQNIKNRIGELYKIKNEILQTVNQVESATLRRLLIKRYIQNLTWEKIAEQLNYSYKHVVHILHPKALSAIKRVLEKD